MGAVFILIALSRYLGAAKTAHQKAAAH